MTVTARKITVFRRRDRHYRLNFTVVIPTVLASFGHSMRIANRPLRLLELSHWIQPCLVRAHRP